ncbi:MAG TPA: DUF3349 domain-containing protein [Nocardioides sp.]|jgi:hypothetical protein|nr:DUF3349 domain-containing protein [Nocardioides sp.]
MTDQQQNTSLAQSVLGWLRAGYPEGIPNSDYLPILGVLQRRLTTEEIESIADGLAEQSAGSDEPISRADIERIITETVYQHASDSDVARVSARLASGGWPLADPHQS